MGDTTAYCAPCDLTVPSAHDLVEHVREAHPRPTLTCPHCGGTEHILGVQIPGVYDGVCYWQCLACDGWWHAFSDGWEHRRRRVEEHLAAFGSGHKTHPAPLYEPRPGGERP